MESPVIDPLEVLTNKGTRQPTVLHYWYSPTIMASIGFLTAVALNWASRKPVFSGIQVHIAGTTIGGLLGVFIDKRRGDYLATRDATLRHYVETHPEDFPPIERKKIGDLLEPWVPIR